MLKKAVCMVLLVALVAMQVPVAALATQNPGASATSLRGTVQMRSGHGAWTVMSGTVPVAAGATVRTGARGEALIQMASGAVVRLSPNTTATLSSLVATGPSPRLEMTLSGRAYARTSGVATRIATRSGVVTAHESEFLLDASTATHARLQVVDGSANLTGPAVHLAGAARTAGLTAMDATRGIVLVADGNTTDQDQNNDKHNGQHHGLTPNETALLIVGAAALIGIIVVLATQGASK